MGDRRREVHRRWNRGKILHSPLSRYGWLVIATMAITAVRLFPSDFIGTVLPEDAVSAGSLVLRVRLEDLLAIYTR